MCDPWIVFPATNIECMDWNHTIFTLDKYGGVSVGRFFAPVLVGTVILLQEALKSTSDALPSLKELDPYASSTFNKATVPTLNQLIVQMLPYSNMAVPLDRPQASDGTFSPIRALLAGTLPFFISWWFMIIPGVNFVRAFYRKYASPLRKYLGPWLASTTKLWKTISVASTRTHL